MSSLCFSFWSTKRKQYLLYSCLYVLSLLGLPANKWKAQSVLWSLRKLFGGALLACPPCAWPDLLGLSLEWVGTERRYGKTVFILFQFHKVLHFPVQTELCGLWHKFSINVYFFHRNGISLQRTLPAIHQAHREKQIEKKQSENSFFLCCLGTRPSGAGAAVQKHHSNGSDKLHPQLPQGKHTIAGDYCEHFFKVTVSFESR